VACCCPGSLLAASRLLRSLVPADHTQGLASMSIPFTGSKAPKKDAAGVQKHLLCACNVLQALPPPTCMSLSLMKDTMPHAWGMSTSDSLSLQLQTSMRIVMHGIHWYNWNPKCCMLTDRKTLAALLQQGLQLAALLQQGLQLDVRGLWRAQMPTGTLLAQTTSLRALCTRWSVSR